MEAVAVIELDGKQLIGHDNFHKEFAATFGFPSFYGQNMDAWIDCMSCLSAPGEQMTSLAVQAGKILTIKINNYRYFKENGPEQWINLLECAAFVNWRELQQGRDPLIALAFYD
ncbi:barstar family protein [Rhizobium lusitanum]|uniref:barstar family protein n=1 Tax=Rhizobium lusitanum TaxID=293958 RepID=UPI0016162268|nr:barstar family protein [Rhizobium lusitanum]QND50283.1 barstar family protein [Rhizobium lusitanum]